ncbi:MAG: exodeoxyribonuclease VII small subunit [Planctomycetota bacterium]
MSKIEGIVVALEGGSLGLGESLREYESAIGELKRCHQFLESAERQVSVLAGIDSDGNPLTESFDESEDQADDHGSTEVESGGASGVDRLVAKQNSRSRRRGASKPSATKRAKSAGSDGTANSEDGNDVPGLF